MPWAPERVELEIVMLEPELPRVDVVVRCRNKMPYVATTLGRLLNQRGCLSRVLLLDCQSTDGSRSAAERLGVRVVDVGPTIGSAGAMMNHAMRITTSPVVVFVDADAIPLSETSVVRLVAAFAKSPTLAAAFGRQVPRRLGVKAEGASFSMAASAVNRTAWRGDAFDERLRYAEDVEWTTRVRRDGWTTEYVADAPFELSHDTTLRGHFLRATGRPFAQVGSALPAPRVTPATLVAARALAAVGARLRT
jgi:GT2 family glycosyltransferase